MTKLPTAHWTSSRLCRLLKFNLSGQFLGRVLGHKHHTCHIRCLVCSVGRYSTRRPAAKQGAHRGLGGFPVKNSTAGVCWGCMAGALGSGTGGFSPFSHTSNYPSISALLFWCTEMTWDDKRGSTMANRCLSWWKSEAWPSSATRQPCLTHEMGATLNMVLPTAAPPPTPGRAAPAAFRQHQEKHPHCRSQHAA